MNYIILITYIHQKYVIETIQTFCIRLCPYSTYAFGISVLFLATCIWEQLFINLYMYFAVCFRWCPGRAVYIYLQYPSRRRQKSHQ